MNPKKITLLFILRDPLTESEQQSLLNLSGLFQQVLVITRNDLETPLQGVQKILYETDKDLVSALNRACNVAENEWVLLLESDETIADSQLAKVEPARGECYPAYLSGTSDQSERWYYDLRLLPLQKDKENQEVFKGTVMPDPSEYVLSNHLEVSGQMIVIEKKGNFLYLEKLKSIANQKSVGSDMEWYWKGVYYSETQRFPQAEKCFKNAMQNEKLLDFYKLSALNGLANVLLNLNKTNEALEVARQSSELDHRQFAPSLIRHKIHWMKGEWKEAYDALHNYLVQLQQASRANLDFFLEPAEAHFLMAEISMILKDRSHAFHHLDLFYQLNGGRVSDDVKDKLFVYAVELNKEEKALEYLRVLFSRFMAEEAEMVEDRQFERILGSISLLEEKEWHQAACEMYEKLYCVKPESQKVLRRWLIALMKSGQLERARKVAKILKKEIPAIHPHPEIQFS
ncbi:MAG: hypothetical protein WD035_03470 [Balneolaceae bacterium]